MGIEQFVLERERKIGEKKGMEEKTLQFIRTMINQTDFDDTKIATLTGVEQTMVENIRSEITK